MNQKLLVIILIFILTVLAFIALLKLQFNKPALLNTNLNNSHNDNSNTTNLNSSYFPPITDYQERVTKKPFGVYITPQTSPVQPEKFTGYHTGVDFETFPDEANIDVPIYAFCDGKILVKEYASGYGGVLVQSCNIENQSVTIIYGHLKLSSINKNVGDNLIKGEEIGILGKGYSTETDGERKHLHFGIHKRGQVTILGYVQVKSELNNWIDPMTLL